LAMLLLCELPGIMSNAQNCNDIHKIIVTQLQRVKSTLLYSQLLDE